MNSKISDTLISFAYSFVSYLLGKINSEKIDTIILFGSVARKDATNKSDIDIFVETKDKKMDKRIEDITSSFYKSTIYLDYWDLLGIKNEIRCLSGNLKEWQLNRSIISEGIIVYGKGIGMDKIKGNSYALFRVNATGTDKEKLRIWRTLYGYKQKMKGREYISNGLIKENDGKKLSPGLFIIPLSNSRQITDFLKKEKMKYELIEFSSDMI